MASAVRKIALVTLFVFVSVTTVFAQDFSAQASIPGSIQTGTWYEQWNQSGPMYCPNNRQRYITSTSEPFTLMTSAGEGALSISYSTSRLQLFMGRLSDGRYVYTDETGLWVHVLELTRLSPTQMLLASTFYAKDGSCTLTNSATWTYSAPANSACAIRALSIPVNKRSGPGLTYPVIGQLLANTSATGINRAVDAQGRPWWQLSDYSWVSGFYTTAQGNCPR